MNNRYNIQNIPAVKFEFFQIAISALVDNITQLFARIGQNIPVYVFNTGDQVMTDEFMETTAQSIPRLVLSVEDLSIQSDNLTSPYQRGEFVVEENKEDIAYTSLVRRIPVKLSIGCQLTVSNVLEMFKWQELILLSLFKQNVVRFQYYKKTNMGAYNLPDDISAEKNLEFGFDDNRRNRTIQFTIEYDLQYPAFDLSPNSLMKGSNVIETFSPVVVTSDETDLNYDPFVPENSKYKPEENSNPSITPNTLKEFNEQYDEFIKKELGLDEKKNQLPEHGQMKQPSVTNSFEPMPATNHHLRQGTDKNRTGDIVN